MFRHVKNYSLHRKILEDRTDAFLLDLKNFPDKKDQLDASHCTPLQLAAKKGNVEAILSLLREGVDINLAVSHSAGGVDLSHKPPLYLAIEHSHYLAAQVLSYFGANKDNAIVLAGCADNKPLINEIRRLHLDPDIFRGVLGWISKQVDENKKIDLLKRLESKIKITPSDSSFDEQKDDMHVILISEKKEESLDVVNQSVIRQDLSGMLELAAAKNHSQLVSYLLETYPESLRTDPHVVSLGYWLALHDDKTNYNKIKDDLHIALTLKQLAAHAPEASFTKYHQQSKPEQKKLYLYSEYKIEKLSPPANELYQLAKFSKLSSLLVSEEKEIQSFEEKEIQPEHFLEAVCYAMHVKNYTALVDLFSFANKFNYEHLLLKTKQRDLLLLHMFLSSQYSFEILQKRIDLQKGFFSLLKIPQEEQGLLYRLMMRGIDGVSDSRTDQEKGIQKAYFAMLQVTEEQWLKMYFKIAHRQEIESIPKIMESLPADRQNFIQSKADRFEIMLHLLGKEQKLSPNQQFFQTQDLVKLTRTYLSPQENARLNSVSQIFTHHHSSLLLLQIGDFQKALQEEIENKSCSEGRYNVPLARRTGLFLLVLCIALASYGTAELSVGADHVRDEMRSVNATSGVPCDDFLQGTRICERSRPLEGCQSLCSQLDGYAVGLICLAIGGILGSLTGLVLTIKEIWNEVPDDKVKLRNAFKGNQRFDYAFISDFSAPVRASAKALFAEFKNDPEFHLTEESTVREIRETLRKYTRQLKTRNVAHTMFAKKQCSQSSAEVDVSSEIDYRENLLEHKGPSI
jgi:hypothetical protein